MNSFGHIGQRIHYVFQNLNVTVLARDISFHQTLPVDIRLWSVVASPIGQELQIVVRNRLIRHISGKEMHHRGCRIVPKHRHSSHRRIRIFSTVILPIFVVRHVRNAQLRNRIIQVQRRRTAYHSAGCRIIARRTWHQLYQISTVYHRRIKQ